MTTAYQPYPKYQDAMLSPTLVGNIPKHWQIARLKRWTSINDKALPDNTDPDYRFNYIEIGAVSNGALTEVPRPLAFRDAPSRARRVVSCGDTIVSTVRPYLKAVWFAETATDLVCSTGFAVLSPKPGTVPKFTAYLAQCNPFIHLLTANSVGTGYPAIPEAEFGDIEVPVPPTEEQAAIVRYLDHADKLINRYISTKEHLIALLEEQRQAVIHQAVTRGLDQSVATKPSGASWLGNIPFHWKAPRLRHLGQAITGLTYDPQDMTDDLDGTLVFRASNIKNGRITYEDVVRVRSKIPDQLITRPGDILICSRSGSRALIGKNVRIDSNSAGKTFGAFMTVFRGEHNDYLHYVFNSKIFEFQSALFATSTINQLTLGMLNDMRTPLPPPHECHNIVAHLQDVTGAIDQAINKADRQTELANEYRTRLIADAVTGQIDVRDAVAKLPK